MLDASIIIALDTEEVLARNFLYLLSKYKNIQNYEIIFITDGNISINYGELIKQYFTGQYKFIEHKEKSGYGVINNIAAEQAACEILIFMNADIILSEGCLENLLIPIREKRCAAVQPLLIYPQTNLTQSTGHVFCKYYNTHLFENRPIYDPVIQKEGQRIAFTTALCAIWRETFFQLGGFDEYYFNAWEGMELGLKLNHAGQKCIYYPKSFAYHIRGGGRGQYKIDERPQSAYFWAKWGNIIEENLSPILNMQFDQRDRSSTYYLINFSSIRDISYITDNLNITITDIIPYTQLSGYSKIELYKTIPYYWLHVQSDIAFFSNNISVINNNKLWFEMRKNHNDILLDLSGNCVKCISTRA